MVNAHCADAIVCISNCDKITPGMLMASMRLNIPVIFVSGGPMEAGRATLDDIEQRADLVTSMVAAASPGVSEADSLAIDRSACPTCGSCSGMFTANSMNCLTAAPGLSLPCLHTPIAESCRAGPNSAEGRPGTGAGLGWASKGVGGLPFPGRTRGGSSGGLAGPGDGGRSPGRARGAP